MFCAVERLPSYIMLTMNFCTMSLPYTGSPGVFRRRTQPFLGILQLLLGGLWPLGAVFRAPLLAIFNAGRIERAAHNVISNAGQILHAAPANEHNRVLLQVVADTRNVRRHFVTVRQ